MCPKRNKKKNVSKYTFEHICYFLERVRGKKILGLWFQGCWADLICQMVDVTHFTLQNEFLTLEELDPYIICIL